jgi:hypothetical protein
MTVAFPLLPPEAWLFHCSLFTSHSALPPNILSVQSSKGLEFRSVIFIGLGQIESLETEISHRT